MQYLYKIAGDPDSVGNLLLEKYAILVISTFTGMFCIQVMNLKILVEYDLTN